MFNNTKKMSGRARGQLSRTSTSLSPATMRCRHCGRVMGDFAGGASMGWHGERLCHPNAKNRPNCYELVINYKHEMPCNSPVCYEDHQDFLTYVDGHPTLSGKDQWTLNLK